MPRQEREQRAPRPERLHPIGQALWSLNRDGWGVFFTRILADGARPTQEKREYEKRALLDMLEQVRAQIEAL